MEIRKLIDNFGDDIFALALIITKNFDSAKQVFVKTVSEYEKYSDTDGMAEIGAKVYSECKECDSNDEAVTLTGIDLNAKQEAVLETVLTKPQIVRAIIHLHYENDLDVKQISKVTGESERYISGQLEELSDALVSALDKHYKDICIKIHAEDRLKSYAIRAAESNNKRMFEVKGDAVPTHSWTKKQKLVVFIVAALVTVLVCIVIPLAEAYRQMEEELKNVSYEEPATDEIFSYTLEAEDFNADNG